MMRGERDAAPTAAILSLDVLRPTTPDRQVKEDALSEDDHEERGEVQRI
jgi:hypothetical protein